jgi:hypothetical protein
MRYSCWCGGRIHQNSSFCGHAPLAPVVVVVIIHLFVKAKHIVIIVKVDIQYIQPYQFSTYPMYAVGFDMSIEHFLPP